MNKNLSFIDPFKTRSALVSGNKGIGQWITFVEFYLRIDNHWRKK